MIQHLDFSHASASMKWTPKRQQQGQGAAAMAIHGFDAPRNSMEFVLETPRSHGFFQEDVPFSCNLRQKYPKVSSSSPIKKLIHEEPSSSPIKKQIHEDMAALSASEARRRPSVVARLMGMDSPPLSRAAEFAGGSHCSGGRRQEIVMSTKTMARRVDPAEMVSTKHVSFALQHRSPVVVRHGSGGGGGRKSSGVDQWSKPQPREHPQEEELQRFKKEFEAWQASRAWERSRALEMESHIVFHDDGDGKCTEIVPYRYQQEQLQQHGGRDGNRRVNSIDGVHWRRRRRESGAGGASISGSRTFSLANPGGGSTRLPLSMFYREEEERSLSPTRIVILRPCPELSADEVEESSLGSPEMMKKENNMEAFLEEVKTRLKLELEGCMASVDRADRWAAAGGGGDIPADPKQIARNIANQIRGTVTMDLHPALARSESTRSYRGSDDAICRDPARKQLSDAPVTPRRRAATTSSSSPFDEEDQPRPKPPRRDMARHGQKVGSKEEKRRRVSAPAANSDDPVSPRNLVRSFSAPSSGTTFVKLLTEEPRALAGARTQRNHGLSPEEERRKGRKDAFGIKGRVSSLRQNLGLRGKLFGKKLHSDADEPPSSFLDELPPIGKLVTAPSVLIHPGVLQENSTEVPPSPASWCSSPPDEMVLRGGYPSPVSPLEASFADHRSPLKPPASSSASGKAEELAETSAVLLELDDDADAAEMDHPMKAFIRAVLVASGLYGQSQSSGHSFFSSCQPVKPIPRWVLEEVAGSSSSTSCSAPAPDADVDHRLLFDLINEALPRVVHGSTAPRPLTERYAGPRSGKKLLDGLWRSVQAQLGPPPASSSSSSVDGLIDRDLSASPWNGAFHHLHGGVAEEVAAELVDELIDETVWDVLLDAGGE